jgi:anti-sigma regulatory factor (Ser/Thr protein kinase)
VTENRGQKRDPRQEHSGAGLGPPTGAFGGRLRTGDEKNHQTETITLTVPSHPKYLYVIRSAVYPVVLDAGFSRKEARRIVLALDEACSNIIKYAYEGDPAQRINVSITVEQDRLHFRLTDTGRKADVSTITPRRLDDIRPGGLGTHFIASVFDSVTYDTSGEKGTVLTLVKEKR